MDQWQVRIFGTSDFANHPPPYNTTHLGAALQRLGLVSLKFSIASRTASHDAASTIELASPQDRPVRSCLEGNPLALCARALATPECFHIGRGGEPVAVLGRGMPVRCLAVDGRLL